LREEKYTKKKTKKKLTPWEAAEGETEPLWVIAEMHPFPPNRDPYSILFLLRRFDNFGEEEEMGKTIDEPILMVESIEPKKEKKS